MKKFYLMAMLAYTATAGAQEKNNFVQIGSCDTEADIVRKAANVVPSKKQLRWQQLELTAFFHFGINTFTKKQWGDGKEDPRLFNPAQLDAEQWVRVMKDAGFRQVIITAKHHDGFCLWPSRYTEHSVKNSPYKNGKGDVVKELAEACKKYKIGFGVYLSPWDRNSLFYGDSVKYNDYFINQLTELLTNYGKVDEVWFDGACGEGPNGKKQWYDFARWYRLIRKLQPSAVIAITGPDVRWVGTESGKGRATEWSVIPNNSLDEKAIAENSQKNIDFQPIGDKTGDDLGSRDKIRKAKGLVWYPAETDVSIRPGWFYDSSENGQVKSPHALMDIYFTSVGMNGVLLLNVPPDKRGLIPDKDIHSLQQWKFRIDKTFYNNVVEGAGITCSNGRSVHSMVDGNYNTFFTTKGQDTTAAIEIDLKQPVSFDVLLLQENITVGQRVERFSFDYQTPQGWKRLAEGTTIGYKRLLKFQEITASKVRINIESSRLNPTLAEIGLYKLAQ